MDQEKKLGRSISQVRLASASANRDILVFLYNNIYIVEFNMALVVRNRIPHRTILLGRHHNKNMQATPTSIATAQTTSKYRIAIERASRGIDLSIDFRVVRAGV